MQIIKSNFKLILGFILGTIISSGTTITVQAALNDLYTIHNGVTAAASEILSGKTAYSGG